MKIAVDFDDVLANTYETLVRLYNQRHHKNVRTSDIVTWNLRNIFEYTDEEMTEFIHVYYDSKEHASMLPVHGSCEGVLKLRESHELVVISARPEHSRPVTNAWIMSHLHDVFSDMYLVGTADALDVQEKKSAVATRLGIDVFIEDSMSNATDIARSGIPVVLLNKPWNQGNLEKGIHRAMSWSDAVTHITERYPYSVRSLKSEENQGRIHF